MGHGVGPKSREVGGAGSWAEEDLGPEPLEKRAESGGRKEGRTWLDSPAGQPRPGRRKMVAAKAVCVAYYDAWKSEGNVAKELLCNTVGTKIW